MEIVNSVLRLRTWGGRKDFYQVRSEGKILERNNEYEKAIKLYKEFIVEMEDEYHEYDHYFNKKLAIVYEKLKRYREAISICGKSLSDPKITDVIEISFYKRMEKLHKKAKLEFISKDIIPKFRTVNIERLMINKGKQLVFLGKSGSELSVEEVALEYYQSEEGGRWDGFWGERIHFFLQGAMDKHFWDIFSDYLTRGIRARVQADILKIKSKNLCKLIMDGIKGCYRGDLAIIQNRMDTLKRINPAWTIFKEDVEKIISEYNRYFHEILEYAPTVIKSLTKKQLAGVISRKAAIYISRGIPDLFLFKGLEGYIEHKFVEVKSQHDKLSDYQLAWIKFLQKNGMNVELCQVNARIAI
ncbi:MAG: hypothetical protein DDT42_00854 [candidate division WS2 bacterium]|uniref:phosphodiesterase I n=1 Tax=Psychracetigena formicireducens TaxID=2986056 RepID=A0A9E2BG57_PSYF1|nr:hypothetical protein [Candidatus Psychracetigena formicireducens]